MIYHRTDDIVNAFIKRQLLPFTKTNYNTSKKLCQGKTLIFPIF